MSVKELMARTRHDDERGALTYQRASSEADERIAAELSTLVDKHPRPDKKVAGKAKPKSGPAS